MTDQLSSTLTGLREQAGVSVRAVAAETDLSLATVSRLLSGQYVPAPEQVSELIEAITAAANVVAVKAAAKAESAGTATATTEAEAAAERAAAVQLAAGDARLKLVNLAADLRERTTRRQVLLRDGAATAQRQYGEIERAAGHVQTFHPAMVTGLLQTADYARLVFSPDDADGSAVAARLDRQAAMLDDPTAPQITQVLAEGALRWQAGSPELMATQCERIAELAGRGDDRIRVGIIPWTQPVEVFPMHGFDLYDERAAIVGTTTGTAYITNGHDVAEYVTTFRQLASLAVYGRGCVALLEEIAEEYRKLAG